MSCTREALARTTCRVLEEAAFMAAELVEEPPAVSELSVQLRFGPPLGGWIRLEASRAFAAVLAANLLGCESGDDEARARAADALGELLNVVAGVLAAELTGGAPCRLGVPESGAPAPVAGVAGEVSAALRAEDEHALRVRLDLGAPT